MDMLATRYLAGRTDPRSNGVYNHGVALQSCLTNLDVARHVYCLDRHEYPSVVETLTTEKLFITALMGRTQ